MIKNYFFLDDSPLFKGKYVIRFNVDLTYFPNGTSGSYNVFQARLLNLSYAEYLRYCRDKLGAEILGKGNRYLVPYFNKTPEVELLVKLLNVRMNYIINEHDYPYEYLEKEEEVIRTPFGERNENK
jgi:hypothetical protein